MNKLTHCAFRLKILLSKIDNYLNNNEMPQSSTVLHRHDSSFWVVEKMGKFKVCSYLKKRLKFSHFSLFTKCRVTSNGVRGLLQNIFYYLKSITYTIKIFANAQQVKLILSAIAIIFLGSCSIQKTEKDIGLINIKEAGKEFYFAEIKGGKVNKKNEIQCSKYSYSRIYDDSLISYGNNLKSTISAIYNTDKKLVKVSKDLDSTTFYSLKYIADNIDSSDMEFINKKLEEKLNIDIKKEKTKVKAYEIFIVNNKLLSYSKKNESVAYSSFRDKKVKLINTNLNSLSKSLSKNTKYFFICNENDDLRINMEFEFSSDFKKLKQEMINNGLNIKEVKIDKEFIFVK